MFAHKYLQQTYKILGDSVNQRKYRDIEFGLLNSILNSGDGKTCESGWHITQIEEEYFILNVIDAQFQTQAITYGGKNACDKMTVKTDDGIERIILRQIRCLNRKRNVWGFSRIMGNYLLAKRDRGNQCFQAHSLLTRKRGVGFLLTES